MLEAVFRLLERHGHVEDGLAVLDGDDAARRERATVADAIDVVDDGLVMSPGRRKYACSEWRALGGVVCTAADSAWPSTWPPKTVPQPRSWLWPRKRFSSIFSSPRSFTSSSSRRVLEEIASG